MKPKIIIIISFIILSGSSIFTSCFREPVPYVFEGIIQPGIENALPVEIVLDAELPAVPEKLPVYRIAAVDEEYIDALAHRLGFNHKPGQPADPDGTYTYIQGLDYRLDAKLPEGTQCMEVYKNGNISIFFEGSRKIESTPVSLPSLEEAKNIAYDWLISHDLHPANISDVKGGGLVVNNAITEEITPYSVIVRFQTTLGDHAVFAPAASVEIGENGKIIGAYINLMQHKEHELVSIKSPKSALSLLKARLASPLVDPPEARESLINIRNFARLTITRVTLQYTSGGGYLQPIYIFDGNAFSSIKPGPETFKGKVDALLRQTPFFNSK